MSDFVKGAFSISYIQRSKAPPNENIVIQVSFQHHVQQFLQSNWTRIVIVPAYSFDTDARSSDMAHNIEEYEG